MRNNSPPGGDLPAYGCAPMAAPLGATGINLYLPPKFLSGDHKASRPPFRGSNDLGHLCDERSHRSVYKIHGPDVPSRNQQA